MNIWTSEATWCCINFHLKKIHMIMSMWIAF
jgi:hypothetical protein